MAQLQAFLNKDVFVLKGFHVTVLMVIVAILIIWWLKKRR